MAEFLIKQGHQQLLCMRSEDKYSIVGLEMFVLEYLTMLDQLLLILFG